MKTSPIAAVILASGLVLGTTTVAAQSSPTPAPTAAPATSTPTQAPPTIQTAPPAPTATPSPVFNFDEVKEVVSELRGPDGRTHYVTLSEDTEGVVRIRLSLFDFPANSYNAVVFRNGDCSKTASYGASDVLGNFPFRLTERAGLVLTFFNTRRISITAGSPNSVYDADGTSLAVYLPGDSGAGPVACARLDQAPGAPATGNSHNSGSGRRRWPVFAGAALLVAAAVAIAATRKKP